MKKNSDNVKKQIELESVRLGRAKTGFLTALKEGGIALEEYKTKGTLDAKKCALLNKRRIQRYLREGEDSLRFLKKKTTEEFNWLVDDDIAESKIFMQQLAEIGLISSKEKDVVESLQDDLISKPLRDNTSDKKLKSIKTQCYGDETTPLVCNRAATDGEAKVAQPVDDYFRDAWDLSAITKISLSIVVICLVLAAIIIPIQENAKRNQNSPASDSSKSSVTPAAYSPATYSPSTRFNNLTTTSTGRDWNACSSAEKNQLCRALGSLSRNGHSASYFRAAIDNFYANGENENESIDSMISLFDSAH